jgi:secondary thiamine-phosphate synthase enzyme
MNQAPLEILKITTSNGEGMYNIDEQVNSKLIKLVENTTKNKQFFDSGTLNLYNMHTSCALLINESYDSTAKEDLERFFKYLAPKNLPFIKHTCEGPDDSPSHMKTSLLSQNLCFPVENSKIIKGTWQGIYLAEFREHPKNRNIYLKYTPDIKY